MQEKPGVVNIYELEDNWEGCRVLSFEKENEKWLDFVCACRKGEPLNKEKVLGELRYYKMNNQICITNQETLNRVLKFQKAYEVE